MGFGAVAGGPAQQSCRERHLREPSLPRGQREASVPTDGPMAVVSPVHAHVPAAIPPSP